MEETCAPEAVPNCMRQTGTIAVRVSIPVCSQSDSKAWRRQPNAACRQVSDPTLDFPYAIALPIKGAGEVRKRASCYPRPPSSVGAGQGGGFATATPAAIV